MGRIQTAALAAACLLGLRGAALADVPITTAFAYQGKLTSSGSAANGQYDLAFTLFGQSTAGTAISGPIILTGTTVTNGLFTVQLDFGANAFNGSARWLEISVKPSAGGYYTTLAPRQPITVTPYALQSRGMYVDQNLNVTVGNQLYVSQSPQFVGINRSARLSSGEVFGITAVTAAAGFGGMYVNASDPTGRPFYGYADNASIKAYHYFDGGDGRWKLYAGAERLTVDSATGYVGIGETSPENMLHVKKGSAGAVTGNPGAPLIVENSAEAYINLLTPSTNESGILFGNPGNTAAGCIIYNNSSAANGLVFRTNGNYTRMVLDGAGNLGVGTTAPTHKVQILQGGTADAVHAVHVGSGQAGMFQMLNSTSTGHALYATSNAQSSATAYFANTYGGPAMQVSGNVGIGTASPAVPLHVEGGTDTSPTGGGYVEIGSSTGMNLSLDENEIMARTNGAASTLYLNNSGGDVVIAPQGTARVRVLEVTGADVAEKFPLSNQVEKGMVVMIDAEHPGQLCLSQGAYNKRVAGVVSGANGLPAGTILGNLPGQNQATPIALSGRVWVHCDASRRAIDVGDMLTTSDRPGYAMAVDDPARAFGAVIGKAMTELQKGQTGLVLVLVNLQ